MVLASRFHRNLFATETTVTINSVVNLCHETQLGKVHDLSACLLFKYGGDFWNNIYSTIN